uniref:Putative reverse transcriptase n=1 Tax=Lutzomyia longipalpis TaxID=7200 RepID=A0A1B0GHU6_LUTLO
MQITVTPDKGGKTVIMSRDSYLSKMDSLIADAHTYKRLDGDVTSRYQYRNNEFVKKLRDRGLVDDWTKSHLITYKAQPPRIYGLPKIHKENVPLRPIVSCVESPTHNLSRFCNDILKNITEKSPYKLKNSYDFVNHIKDLVVDDDDVLVSFDVVSLFTNIPRGLALKLVEERWDDISAFTDIPRKLFVDMVSLIMDSGFFKYRGDFYKQIDGMPMGNCLSPVIADITLDHIMDSALKTYASPLPKVILKYVDDLFLITHKDNVLPLLTHFNTINHKIQFTHELEKDSELPFLDTLVRRNRDGSLTTNWYQKPMASGRILSFSSLHPMKQKINTAGGLIHRVKSLTTDPLTDTNKIITDLLVKNKYPRHIIGKLLEKHNSKGVSERGDSSFNTIVETKYCSMTYIKGLSENISKTIRNRSDDITICFRTHNSVGNFFTNMKDKIPVLDRSNVIYRVPCECGMFYLGRTSRKLGTRINEHKRTTKDFSKTSSSLVAHMRDKHHNFSFENVKIVDTTNRSHQLNYMEAFHINSHQRMGVCVNHRSEGNELNQLYSALIPNSATRQRAPP